MKDKFQQLQVIYDRIPKMKDCKGLCEDTCTVIPCSPFEQQRIEKKAGKPLTFNTLAPGKIRCSMLTKDGKCSVYNVRPFICRAWGTVDHPYMRCEHGCVPERWLSNKEFMSFLMQVEIIAGHAEIPDIPGRPQPSDEELLAAAMLMLK